MIQILVPDIYNSKRTRKEELKRNRKSIKESNGAIVREKLFKVKHADNDILFNDPLNPNRNIGGHYVLTVGYNPNNDNVAVTTITSLEDKEGNPIKQGQLEKGLILPIDHFGLPRKSGIKQEVLTKNKHTNQNILYNSLENTGASIDISKSNVDKINDFLFNNSEHEKGSRQNRIRTRDYIKK